MMSYNSATGDVNRLAKSKNLTMFYEELASNTLPQWIWVTPNMTSDGHDSSITVVACTSLTLDSNRVLYHLNS